MEKHRKDEDKWRDDAFCLVNTLPIDTFFDDVSGADIGTASSGYLDEAGLDRARGFCWQCPVRKDCARTAMAEEKGLRKVHRFGVRAGLTAGERFRLASRGVDFTDGEEPFDYIDWSPTETLPKRGDGWTDRHTKLEERLLAWMLENLSDCDTLPSVGSLSRELVVRENDLRRVLRSLVEADVLEVTGDPRAYYQVSTGLGDRVASLSTSRTTTREAL